MLWTYEAQALYSGTVGASTEKGGREVGDTGEREGYRGLAGTPRFAEDLFRAPELGCFGMVLTYPCFQYYSLWLR